MQIYAYFLKIQNLSEDVVLQYHNNKIKDDPHINVIIGPIQH